MARDRAFLDDDTTPLQERVAEAVAVRAQLTRIGAFVGGDNEWGMRERSNSFVRDAQSCTWTVRVGEARARVVLCAKRGIKSGVTLEM